ncbi:hypothetical protein GOODEAATRI_013035 [Goodea atripinnis]|uniref:Uncharacterized protein n=1 Tax=Goodea atripinnis TaxID=208336 RepID=A0ABV0N0Y0_9TELE
MVKCMYFRIVSIHSCGQTGTGRPQGVSAKHLASGCSCPPIPLPCHSLASSSMPPDLCTYITTNWSRTRQLANAVEKEP